MIKEFEYIKKHWGGMSKDKNTLSRINSRIDNA